MDKELLYTDRSTGKRFERERLPLTKEGLVTFLADSAVTYGEKSRSGWDSIYRQRHGKGALGQGQAAGKSHPPPVMEDRLRPLPYFSHLLRLASALEPGSPALEVGCGTAGTSLALAGESGTVPYGVDISRHAAIEASRRFAWHGFDPVTLSLSDATSLPFDDNTFPLVFGKTVFEHFDCPRRAAQEIFRVTAPGGHVVMDVPNSRNSYWTCAALRSLAQTHTTNLYSIEDLRAFFEDQGFEIAETWGSWIIYTTPYILLNEVFRFDKHGGRGGEDAAQEPAGSAQALKSGGPASRILISPLVLADRLFKETLRKFNELCDRQGWTSENNGILIGVVARKPGP
ncbi:MAG: class I SAM-dependent methyltransferase [Gemmatimonadota bacterium]|nr:class I SAM-dependent methyltransferase [Gemmatimonadota bacterium]